MGRIKNNRDPNAPLISDEAIVAEMDPSHEFRAAMRAVRRLDPDPEFSDEAETAEAIEKAVRAIDEVIERYIDPIIDRPGAEYLKEALRRKTQAHGDGLVRGVELLETVKRMLRRNKFKGPCPMCGGSGCGECFGKRWVTVAQYADLTKARR